MTTAQWATHRLRPLWAWLTKHRHLLVYLVMAGFITVLFVRSDTNRTTIVNNAEESLLAICEAQRDNRDVLRKLVDFSADGTLTHDQILEIQDPELRLLMLGAERRREQLAELKEELLPPIECERLDLRGRRLSSDGYGAVAP